MKYIKIILFTFLFLILVYPNTTFAKDKEINIYLFYGDGCPHCAKEEEFLDKYVKTKTNINVTKYEVWNDFSNKILWSNIQKMLNKNATGVPYLVIGNQVISGYNESQTDADIKYIINYYEENDYRDLVGEYIGTVEVNNSITLSDKDILNPTVTVPLLGKINVRGVSLAVVASVIGIVDGFNPCAMWVLLFLITMLIGMKDRKKMWILGITFLITSALVYLMFMLSWLNFAAFAMQISLIRNLIASAALAMGIFNLFSFFKKSKDGCEVVDDKKRKKIIERVKGIVTQNKFILAIIGIILLAASVNVIELLCSAGLPLMFTNILALNNLNAFQSGFYFFLYILFFLIDDIIIFSIAMISFKVTGISTKYTRYSHLIGGLVMILIGLLLVFKPEFLMFNF